MFFVFSVVNNCQLSIIFRLLLSYPYQLLKSRCPFPVRKTVGTRYFQIIAQLCVYLSYRVSGLYPAVFYNFESSAFLMSTIPPSCAESPRKRLSSVLKSSHPPSQQLFKSVSLAFIGLFASVDVYAKILRSGFLR